MLCLGSYSDPFFFLNYEDQKIRRYEIHRYA